MKKLLLIALLAAAGLPACQSEPFIDRRFATDRAELGLEPIAAPAEAAPVINPSPTGTTLPGVLEPTIRGTWTFTTPTTVTRLEHVTDSYSQYSLYYGRPAPGDTPFVVITVGPAQDEKLPDESGPTSERDYVLNGNIAHERVGHLTDGAAFCALSIHRPDDPADTCSAVAIAKTSDQRKLALEILASIAWSANKP